jgi:hypothetical protein
MKLRGREGFLELQPSNTCGQGTPGESDILLNVTVRASSYSAADQSWVVADAWDGFLTELGTLDERRQGRAVVEGASPDDLRLEFYSTDSAGHMQYRGILAGTGLTATVCNCGLAFLSNQTCCQGSCGHCVLFRS